MPLAVINHVNVLGHAECSLIVLTNCLGRVIGDYTPNVGKTGDEDESVVNDLYASMPPALSGMPGVSLVEEGSADMIQGVDLFAVFDIVTEPTGMDIGGLQADPPQDEAVFDDAVFDTAFDDGLEQQAVTEPNESIGKTEVVSTRRG